MHFRKSRIITIPLLLFLLTLTVYNCASLRSQAGRTFPGLANFGVLEDGKVCRSAQPANPKGFRTFKQWGGKVVVNLRDDRDERHSVTEAGLTPYWFRLDTGDPPSVDQIEQIVETVANPANQPVLVHCKFGQDRTGLIIASYRIIENQWTYDRAYKELKTYAFAGIEVHRGIVKRLAEVAAKHEKRP